MKTDVQNLTESAPRLERVEFDIDASNVSLATVKDLKSMARAAVQHDDVRHLFDQDYHISADIHKVTNPLKFTVRALQRPRACCLQRTLLVCCCLQCVWLVR